MNVHAMQAHHHHTEVTQAANLWLEELSKDSINDPLDSLRMVWQQVRSQGCVVPGCHTVGVQEYALDLNEYLRIAPNPVSNVLQAELDLPAGTTLHGHVRAVLLNAQGQQVHAGPMQKSGVSLSLREDVGAMPCGVYYLHLADEKRWLAGGKVVRE